MNLSLIAVVLGWVMAVEGILMIPCGLVGLLYGETSHAVIYIGLGAGCGLLGLILARRRLNSSILYAREGLVAVGLSWIELSLIGCLPFWFSGDIPRFEDALFEIVSGFTTTGSSILVNVEAMSRCNLFWRSFSHWIGGMGVLVFMLAVLPQIGGGSSMNLMKAESPGPSVGKLVPKVQQTAFVLYGIYFAMSVVEFLLLLAGGMSWFEAACNTFGSAGTGGFGVKADSIAGYSVYLQNVITVFMFLFGVNFSFYYLILVRKVKDAFAMEEVKWYLMIYLGTVTLITACLVRNGYRLLPSIQSVAFQVSSVMTTTGYATTDFNQWPQFARAMLVCIMFVGACAGSTGGGLKVSRILIYWREMLRELIQQTHPRRVAVVKAEGKVLDRSVLRTTNGFLMAYILIFVVSFLIVCTEGFDLETCFTAVAATLNNIGPGLNMVGPAGNFSAFSPLCKFVLMIDMLIGRLEIWPVIILFHPGTWKK